MFYLNICGMTFFGHDEVQHHTSKDLCGPRLVGIRRIRTFHALRGANAANKRDVSTVYELWGFGFHGLAYWCARRSRKHRCRRLRRPRITKIVREDCRRQVDGCRSIAVETYQRSYARPSYLSLDFIWSELPLTDCVDRGLNQQRKTIKHTEIVAYITLRRDSEPNVYCTRNMRVHGKLGILREKALGNPVPHLLRRNVLNPPRLGVRSSLCFSWATILRSTSRFLCSPRAFGFGRILLQPCVRTRK